MISAAQHNDELKEKEKITMALNVTEEIEDSLQNNPSNLNVSEGKIFPSHYTYSKFYVYSREDSKGGNADR